MKHVYTLLLAVVMMAPGVLRAQSASTELTNLVVFVRFADDEEIDHPFYAIDSMFNSREPGYYSVYNYYDAMTYGRIHYNTVYTSNVQNGVIVSYRDTLPRGAFQPWSETNPIGYQFEIPFMGVCMFEAQLLARILDYVDSAHLVPDSVVLDGNGDGFIDNVSFVVKGGVGAWASLLWPHMEYFPHDSIDHPVTVNGMRPNTFNFEFEGAGEDYFNAGVFCHEMGHSLGLPDLYHYTNYRDVSPAGYWDIMSSNALGPNHTAAIYKHKVLHVCDAPVEITADGDYTLLSVGSSPLILTSGSPSSTATAATPSSRALWAAACWRRAGLIAFRWTTVAPSPTPSSTAAPACTSTGSSGPAAKATRCKALCSLPTSASRGSAPPSARRPTRTLTAPTARRRPASSSPTSTTTATR